MIKRVCHLTSAHTRYDVRIFQKECCSLATNTSFEVHLVVADDHANETKNKVHIHSVGKPKGRLRRIFFKPFQVLIKGLSLKADIYHFHDPELIFSGIILKILNKTVIYDVHEDLPRQIFGKYWIPKPLRAPLSCIIELIEDNASKRFNYIFTATEFIRDRYKKINTNTIEILNYPILSKSFTFEEITFDKKTNSICYIGSISEIRGLKTLIDALATSKCEKLYLIGDIRPTSFKYELESSPGWKKTEFLGHRNKDEIKDIILKCKAGVITFFPLPNHIHACPNKFFEYMQMGLPIIASNFKLWKEIIQENKSGYNVDPENTNEISKTLDKVMDLSHEKMIEISRNGLNSVHSKFNWNIEESKLLKVYSTLT